MSNERKGVQVRYYLTAEEHDALKELKSRLRTESEAWILKTVTGAALLGIAQNGYKFPLPLKLAVSPEIEAKTPRK